MFRTDQTFSPITPGRRLLTGRRWVDTLLRRPSAPKRFGGGHPENPGFLVIRPVTAEHPSFV